MPSKPAKPPREIPKRMPPPEDTSDPELYVTRLPEPSRRFVWEIRRLSAIVLERSREDFATVDQALQDGTAALTALTRR